MAGFEVITEVTASLRKYGSLLSSARASHRSKTILRRFVCFFLAFHRGAWYLS
jgi:hypothetical protein